MRDLLERIRDAVQLAHDAPVYRMSGALLSEAAAEIERLRAINARYKRALDEIARHDLQFVAISALRNA